MKTINKTTLTGMVNSPVDIRLIGSGLKVVTFALETDDVFISFAGEKEKYFNMHIIQCFGKLAEIAERYIKQGTAVNVEGTLITAHKEGMVVVQARELLIVTGC